MSFSRCKALLRLAKNSPRGLECDYKIGLRLYSRKITFRSAAPHDLGIEQRDSYEREEPRDPFEEAEGDLGPEYKPRIRRSYNQSQSNHQSSKHYDLRKEQSEPLEREESRHFFQSEFQENRPRSKYNPRNRKTYNENQLNYQSSKRYDSRKEQSEPFERKEESRDSFQSEFQENRPRSKYNPRNRKTYNENQLNYQSSKRYDSRKEQSEPFETDSFNESEYTMLNLKPKYKQQNRRNYIHDRESEYENRDHYDTKINYKKPFVSRTNHNPFLPSAFEEESINSEYQNNEEDYKNKRKSKYLNEREFNERRNKQHVNSEHSETKKYTFQSDLEFPDEVFYKELNEQINHETDFDDIKIDPKNKKPKKLNYRLEDNPNYKEEHSFDTKTTNFGNEQLEEERTIVKLEPDHSIVNPDNLTVLSPVENGETGNKVLTKYKILETPQGSIKYNLSNDEFNIDEFLKGLTDVPGPLDECKEDLSDFGPNFSPTFNFAAYADKSVLIQQFVKLGVKLYKVEKNQDHMRALLSIDLEKELPTYLHFLHDCGVPADCLGDVITENPMILKEDLDDMKTRIRYLRAHKFTIESIARIVTKNPTWLCWATKCIDERLGHFQNEFKLGGSDIRFLATKQPKLITYNMKHIHENTFAVREQMGFNPLQMKILLLSRPRIWMMTRKKIVDSFDYLHNTMKLPHILIASQPEILTCRQSRIKNRHEFLVELKKDQYDPKKSGYIAPNSVLFGSDEEFCRDIAKTAVETYNLFLKTR